MRRILVDHGRALRSAKRGQGAPRIPIDEALDAAEERAADVVALDDALKALAKIDPRQAEVVELRLFAGLTHEEIAEVLGVNSRTVKRDWRMARIWLHRELGR